MLKKKPFKNYFGGKEGNGVYQTIINHIRPHVNYLEWCLGGGAVYRYKRPSKYSYLNDLNENVYTEWKNFFVNEEKMKVIIEGNYYNKQTRITLTNVCVMKLLKQYVGFPDKTVIFLDLPYPHFTRTSNTRYKHELTNKQHEIILKQCLQIVKKYPLTDILITCYKNKLYDKILAGWYTTEYDTITRAGKKRKECLYYNFKKPTELHDYRYLGNNFYKRQKMRQKINRYVKKLSALPEIERNAIMFNLNEIKNDKSNFKA